MSPMGAIPPQELEDFFCFQHWKLGVRNKEQLSLEFMEENKKFYYHNDRNIHLNKIDFNDWTVQFEQNTN